MLSVNEKDEVDKRSELFASCEVKVERGGRGNEGMTRSLGEEGESGEGECETGEGCISSAQSNGERSF